MTPVVAAMASAGRDLHSSFLSFATGLNGMEAPGGSGGYGE